MKFALCNELYSMLDVESVIERASILGYHGLELAPFTLSLREWERMTSLS